MAQNVGYKMIVIGGSAGSLNVILKIVAELPLHTGAAFVIVIHRRNDSESVLDELIASRTMLAVKEIEDKDEITSDTIFIAPPDYHLLLEDKKGFSLDSSEKVNFSRPSIDVFFESAAEVFGPQCIGVLLSGANADGALGLKKIQEKGGFTIIQDPESAEVPYMPQQAIAIKAGSVVLTPDHIAGELTTLLSNQ